MYPISYWNNVTLSHREREREREEEEEEEEEEEIEKSDMQN